MCGWSKLVMISTSFNRWSTWPTSAKGRVEARRTLFAAYSRPVWIIRDLRSYFTTNPPMFHSEYLCKEPFPEKSIVTPWTRTHWPKYTDAYGQRIKWTQLFRGTADRQGRPWSCLSADFVNFFKFQVVQFDQGTVVYFERTTILMLVHINVIRGGGCVMARVSFIDVNSGQPLKGWHALRNTQTQQRQ